MQAVYYLPHDLNVREGNAVLVLVASVVSLIFFS